MTDVARTFSARAKGYARFRPRYPAELFAWLADQCPERRCAVDIGAGNGQASTGLAAHFTQVLASDASEAQLRAGRPWQAARPVVAEAARQPLPDRSVTLVAVAQALHWFATPAFFTEVSRLLTPGGLFAAWSYGLVRISPAVDALIDELHGKTLAGYWPAGRDSVDAGYRDIEVPFERLPAPDFSLVADWRLDDLLGYLSTWSAVEQWSTRHGADPVRDIQPALHHAWGQTPRLPARWPLSWIIGHPGACA